MIKFILVVLFLGCSMRAFSSDIQQITEGMNLHDESLALVYIGSGNENLLSHHYELALDDFHQASSLISRLEKKSVELNFLVFLGKTIAYDNLGLRDQCENTMLSLLQLVSEGIEDEKDETAFDSDLDMGSMQDYEEASNILKRIASLASSSHVRESLLSLEEEMSKQLLPTFKIAGSTFLGSLDWKYENRTNNFSLQLCKSRWWKNGEKTAQKVYNTIVKAKEVWDTIKDIKKDLKKHKKKNKRKI